jgi:hypothetical protein
MKSQAVSFSDVQLATLRIWRATRPHGLCVRIIRDFGSSARAAEVSHQDPTEPRWRLEARSDGTILLTDASGTWKIGSIEAALEHASKFGTERRGLGLQLQGPLAVGGMVTALPGGSG